MSFEEIEQDTAHKAAFDDWMRVTDGSFAFPEGGDSVNSFYARVRGGLAELEGLHRLKELRAVTTETTQSPSWSATAASSLPRWNTTSPESVKTSGSGSPIPAMATIPSALRTAKRFATGHSDCLYSHQRWGLF